MAQIVKTLIIQGQVSLKIMDSEAMLQDRGKTSE